MKPGYKQTEVGLIPEDWSDRPLEEYVRITSGESPSLYDFTVGGRPYFKVEQLSNAKKYLNNFSTPYHFEKGRTVPRGSVIFAKRGAAIALNKVRILAQESFMDTNLMALTPTEELDGEFLFYALSYAGLWKFADTTSVPQINNKHVKPLILPVPKAAEQRAIAMALSDVDGLLGALDRLIAKKRDLKHAAMQQLLTGQTRLPGFHGAWNEVCLGELFTFKNGLNKGKEFFGFGTPIVNYLDVFGNTRILCSRLEGRVSLTNQELTNFNVKRGDVLFTRTSETPEEIGMASVICDEPTQTVFSGFVLRGRPKNDKLCDAFKAYCFRSSFVRMQIISKASYTTRALTNGRILSAVVLLVPPKPEQTAIAEMLSAMDAELTGLEQRLEKTRALKQGMMQELLTGKTRLIKPGDTNA